jgi:flagellar biosynthesis/type III secretory pathway protein FliH
MIARARILARADARDAKPLSASAPAAPARRRMPRVEADAHLEGARIVREATAQAEALLASARAAASDAVTTAVAEARARADAEMTARWLALHDAERRRFEAETEPLVPVAVALAERLVGAALDLDASRVASMARVVLGEAHGTRRAAVEAHPADAALLAAVLSAEGLALDAFEVRADEALARGELRLHTEMGTIDARLHPRFEQLAAALRDALRAQPSRR